MKYSDEVMDMQLREAAQQFHRHASAGKITVNATKLLIDGRVLLFKKFACINTFCLEIDERDPDRLVEMSAAREPTFRKYARGRLPQYKPVGRNLLFMQSLDAANIFCSLLKMTAGDGMR